MNPIYVCNREQIQQMDPSGEPKALISISSPEPFGSGPARLQDGWAAVLRLEFHDVTLLHLSDSYRLFDEEMAREILDFFYAEIQDKPLWVHCDAGMSRSMGVASFLSMITDRPLEILTPGIADDRFRNIHVVNLLRRVFEASKFNELLGD